MYWLLKSSATCFDNCEWCRCVTRVLLCRTVLGFDNCEWCRCMCDKARVLLCQCCVVSENKNTCGELAHTSNSHSATQGGSTNIAFFHWRIRGRIPNQTNTGGCITSASSLSPLGFRLPKCNRAWPCRRSARPLGRGVQEPWDDLGVPRDIPPHAGVSKTLDALLDQMRCPPMG